MVLVVLAILPFALAGCGGGNCSCPTPVDQTMALSRLAKLSQAISLYVRDYDEIYPLAKNQKAMQTALAKYVSDPMTFVNPTTNIPFEFNYAISGTPVATILTDLSQTVYAYDPSPVDTSARGVGLANLESKLVTEAQWQQLKTSSKIP